MQNKLSPRFFIIGLVLLWGIWSLWPTFKLQTLTDDERSELSKQGNLETLESRAIKQGLDLKGVCTLLLRLMFLLSLKILQ